MLLELEREDGKIKLLHGGVVDPTILKTRQETEAAQKRLPRAHHQYFLRCNSEAVEGVC